MTVVVAPSMPASRDAQWLPPAAWPEHSKALFLPRPFSPRRTHWGLPVVTQYDQVKAALLNTDGAWSREVPLTVLPRDKRHCTLDASWGADGEAHAALRRSLTPINRGSTNMARVFTTGRAISLFSALLEESAPWDLARVIYQLSMEVMITQTLLAPSLLPHIDRLRHLIREHVTTKGGFFGITRQPEAEKILGSVLTERELLLPGGVADHLVREHEHDKISREQLIGQLWLMCASHETQATATASTIGMLLQFNELEYARRCVDNPDAMRVLIDEAMRRSVVFPASVMVATKPVQLDNRTIAPGTACLVSNAAANLDPSKFDRPEVFDPRAERSHPALAFGHGPHRCQGDTMARQFMEDVLKAALKVLPEHMYLPKGGKLQRETSISMAVNQLFVTIP
jgi:cytochrome P450